MLKIYCGQPIPGRDLTEILWPNLGAPQRKQHRWGESIFRTMQPVVLVHQDPATADFFLLPHNYGLLKHDLPYVNAFLEQARKYQKTTVIFIPGDSDQSLDFQDTIIFRHSQYRYKLKKNEIIMPAYIDDLLAEHSFQILDKGDMPSVGFCGWAASPTLRQELVYTAKIALSLFQERVVQDPHALQHRKGLWFRQQAMQALEATPKIKTDFLIRKSYSVNEKTRIGDQAQLRQDFIDNVTQNYYTLSVKGDGNYSQRFFETLCLGRRPLFVDTGCVLPLDDEIAYDELVLRIPCTEIAALPRSVIRDFATMDELAFEISQRKARQVFEKYLRIDLFFNHVFTKEYLLSYALSKA